MSHEIEYAELNRKVEMAIKEGEQPLTKAMLLERLDSNDPARSNLTLPSWRRTSSARPAEAKSLYLHVRQLAIDSGLKPPFPTGDVENDLLSLRQWCMSDEPQKAPNDAKKEEDDRNGGKGKRFRVALSFSGEHREFLAEVANCLAGDLGPELIFYDKNYEAELARLNLDIYLQKIYHDDSDLIAIFLCAEYEKKDWCGLEWRAIRDLIKKRNSDAIMPFRFDSTEIPGLFSIDGYVAIGQRTPNDVASLILQRLNHNEQQI